jgi:hypothetical protein
MVAMFQIGNGGPLFAGTAGPRITSIDLAGSLWGNNPARYDAFAGAQYPAQLQELSVSLKASGDRVTATGLLCTLRLDTAGFSGTFDLRMKSTVAGHDSSFSLAGVSILPNITNGTLVFGGAPTAPPLSIARLPGGGISLSFPSTSGVNYGLEWTTNVAGTWTAIPGSLSGTGATITWTDDGSQTGSPPTTAPRRFYRVRLL